MIIEDDTLPFRQRLAEDAAAFHQRGWLLGTCGNLSVKLAQDPLKMLITASGIDKSDLYWDHFLTVGAGGALIEPSEHRPSSEGTVHEVVYTRTHASACYHVHTIWNNLASRLFRSQGAVTFDGVEMVKGLSRSDGSAARLTDVVRLPIVDNHHDMLQLARNVEAGLDPEVPAVLVYQHGIYVWGKDAPEACRHVEVLEFLLEYACRLHQFGQVV